MLRLLFISLVVSFGLAANAGPHDEIAERIQKVGTVCLEGEECAANAGGATVAAAAGSFDVEATYNRTCATCHVAGIAGAPKLGDTAGWEPRLAKGMDALYNSGINGIPPAMPAKGMCFQCSDDDIKALVDYMVQTVQ